LNASELQKFDTLLFFTAPDASAATAAQDFAKRGGFVVLINLRGDFPWHALQPARKDKQLMSYSVGTGQIVELAQPVIDPEAFSQDLRRMLGAERTSLGLWNSLTTVAVEDGSAAKNETIVHLVNYALESQPVQVQVKGSFSSIRYESPEGIVQQTLTGAQR